MKNKAPKRICFIVVILSFIQGAYPQSRQYKSYRKASKSQQEMLATITAKLRADQRSAIIELNGQCYANAIARSSPVRAGFHGAANDLTDLLNRYGIFDIRAEKGGATIIREHGIEPDGLDIVLPSVAMEMRDRNDPNAGVEAILNNDTVTTLLARQHTLFVDSWEKLQTPLIAKPPLPSHSAKASLEETIQTLLRAFPGIAVYQQCTKPNGEKLIEINFDRY